MTAGKVLKGIEFAHPEGGTAAARSLPSPEHEAGLYPLAPARAGEAAPTAQMVAGARKLLDAVTLEQASRLTYAVDALEWQSWANPEFMQHDTGLRLDGLEGPVRDAVFAVVEASLSPAGFELVRNLMRINGFLGELVELPLLMNEFSYNLALYGDQSETEPWGWQLFGHHAAPNCLVAGTQLVISPVFMGAEPDVIDAGRYQGVAVFKDRIALARELMAALPPALRAEATVYEAMVDPAMPEGRLHAGDERHLGGYFQDNRVSRKDRRQRGGARSRSTTARALQLDRRLGGAGGLLFPVAEPGCDPGTGPSHRGLPQQ